MGLMPKSRCNQRRQWFRLLSACLGPTMKGAYFLLLIFTVLEQGCKKASEGEAERISASERKLHSKREKILSILGKLKSTLTPAEQERLAQELREARREPNPPGEHVPTVFIVPLKENQIPVEWTETGAIKTVLIDDPFSKPREYESFEIPVLSKKALEIFRASMNEMEQ